MIVVWMGYALAVSAVLAAAALLVEYASRLYGKPVRWLWATSLLGSLALPVLAWLLAPVAGAGAGAGATGSAGVTVAEPVVAGIAAATAPSPWHAWLAAAIAHGAPVFFALWVLGSLLVAALGAVSYLRLRRQRARWHEAEVEGTPVLLSEAVGPAVVGLRRPRIVLPRWVLAESEGRRRLILAHEREHVEAGDGRLLASAWGALVLAPWNVPAWWQLRRLRLAVEVDCDARVLRSGANVRGYAGLLLEVGERFGTAASAAAFAEPRSLLGRRLRALTAVPPARRGWRAAAMGAAALAVIVLAGAAPRPDRARAASPTAPDAMLVPGGDSTPNYAGVRLAPADKAVPAAHGGGAAPAARREGDPATNEGRALVRASARPDTPVIPPPRMNPAPPLPAGGESVPAPRTPPDEPARRQAGVVTSDTVMPALKNRDEAQAALIRSYPPLLKAAGVGGTALVSALVERGGNVANAVIKTSSGRAELDSAAIKVARTMAFTPARVAGQPAAVRIVLPIVFKVAVDKPAAPGAGTGSAPPASPAPPGIAAAGQAAVPDTSRHAADSSARARARRAAATAAIMGSLVPVVMHPH